MKKLRSAMVALLLALSLAAAAPAFAATGNNYSGSNTVVSQLQNNGQQQPNPMQAVSPRNQQNVKMVGNNCPTGIQVPSPMGTW